MVVRTVHIALGLSLLTACGRFGFDDQGGGDRDSLVVLDALPIESDPGLVAYWPFDEPAGATSFADATGHGNTATCTQCPPSGAPGRRGHAVAFEQANAGIHVNAQVGLSTLSGPFTAAAWVKVGPPTGPGTYGVILSNDRDCCGTYNGFSLWATFYDHGPALLAWNGSVVNTFTDPLAPATWAHVVGTFDGTTARVYVNGVLTIANAATVGSPFTFDLWIGALGYQAPNYHTNDTSIDELLVLDRALTDAEVAALFASY